MKYSISLYFSPQGVKGDRGPPGGPGDKGDKVYLLFMTYDCHTLSLPTFLSVFNVHSSIICYEYFNHFYFCMNRVTQGLLATQVLLA